MSAEFAEIIANLTYDKSANPEHVDNDSQDFQDGYIAGSLVDINDTSDEHPINKEYRRRACPKDNEGLAKFKEWKRGYWAGIFRYLDV